MPLYHQMPWPFLLHPFSVVTHSKHQGTDAIRKGCTPGCIVHMQHNEYCCCRAVNQGPWAPLYQCSHLGWTLLSPKAGLASQIAPSHEGLELGIGDSILIKASPRFALTSACCSSCHHDGTILCAQRFPPFSNLSKFQAHARHPFPPAPALLHQNCTDRKNACRPSARPQGSPYRR